jgi:hypothetical protein
MKTTPEYRRRGEKEHGKPAAQGGKKKQDFGEKKFPREQADTHRPT